MNRLRTDDSGIALVLVVGMTAVLAALIAVGTAIGIRSLRSSTSHANFENSMAVTEAGVDSTLAVISAAFNGSPSTTFTTTGSCALTAPGTTFASEAAERDWATTALGGLPDSCLASGGGGQYIAVRPTNRQAVYAMGWYPSRHAPKARRRLVKAEYLFAPYKPTNAVLTNGSLDFSGSVAVQALVSTTSADVHTNANITGYNNSLHVTGAVSATGSLPGACPNQVTGGCSALTPVQSLPTNMSARAYYSQAAANPSTWFDLCPDGTVHSPGVTPCTGTQLGTSGYNGWQCTGCVTPASTTTAPVWTLPRTAGGPYPGTYYVYQGNAQIGDSGNSSTTWPITVLAEARTSGITNSATCNKLGGNIDWKLFNMTPKLPGLQLLADGNLTGSANNDAGSGLFLAGDKVDINTSSASLTGAVIAANSCAAAGGNSIQGVTINYDDTLESPLSDVIRTALWLEYPGGIG